MSFVLVAGSHHRRKGCWCRLSGPASWPIRAQCSGHVTCIDQSEHSVFIPMWRYWRWTLFCPGNVQTNITAVILLLLPVVSIILILDVSITQHLCAHHHHMSDIAQTLTDAGLVSTKGSCDTRSRSLGKTFRQSGHRRGVRKTGFWRRFAAALTVERKDQMGSENAWSRV